MNLIDHLESPTAALPFLGEDDLEALLARHFADYLAVLPLLDPTDPAEKIVLTKQAEIKYLCDRILNALRHNLDDAPEKAQHAFNEGITPLDLHVQRLTSNPVSGIKTGPLFRVRIGNLNSMFTKQDLFHIPFHQLVKVQSQRYSNPELPCLYLGRSIYVCWEEMSRPDRDKMWISKFVVPPQHEIQVLDFGYCPNLVAAGLKFRRDGNTNGITEDFAAAYTILWPLVAACSVRRPHDINREIVVEYVISQLLFKWLVDRMQRHTSLHIDGIRYYSTHVENPGAGIVGMSYAFPAQQRKESGHCPVLRSKLHLTQPVNWRYVSEVPRAAHTDFNRVSFEMVPGKVEAYKDTDFARIEDYVHSLPAEPL